MTQPGCTDWGSSLSQRQDNTRIVFDGRMSYVTGSHNVKFGYTHEIGPDGRMANEYNGDIQAALQQRPANQVTVLNTPIDAPGLVHYDSAFFVQDSWTIKRLTVNPGVRIEWFSAGMEGSASPAGRFVPDGSFPRQHDLIKWGPDYAPAFLRGVRPFGNGRTAHENELQQVPSAIRRRPGCLSMPTGTSARVRNWFDCRA